MCNTKNRSDVAPSATRSSSARIKRGVDWLDAAYPAWRSIDPDGVDMSDVRLHLLSHMVDVSEFPQKPGKGATPRHGYDAFFFYLKNLVDRPGAFEWLRAHGFLESTEDWERYGFDRSDSGDMAGRGARGERADRPLRGDRCAG